MILGQIVFFMVLATSQAAPPAKCDPANGAVLPNTPQIASAIKSCLNSTKFTFPEIKSESDLSKFFIDFEATKFDDKCFAKCVGDELKLITSDQKLNRQEFLKLLKFSIEKIDKVIECYDCMCG
ncbi:hypothetical protein Fcan01_21667 [Folsomia candida]|uniref:Uncharacterized protein n=1 Tax=Folsomia candida TaxID=158441 RepID=A0A226DFV7_FOLCA|nr:hypothetical protein Fcan01_21667 [Folsomia candida]